jgi:hypothetical protein
MSHITTWPNFYNNSESYIAHSWDFSDYGLLLDEIINFPEKYNELARNGRNSVCSKMAN